MVQQRQRRESLIIESAEILPGGFRNFRGEKVKFNPNGDRYFNVVIPEEIVEPMIRDGWNVKFLEGMDAGDPGRYIMKVAVSYKVRAPRVFLVTGEGSSQIKTMLGENLISMLDSAEIEFADVSINPSPWEVNGEKGIKAYLNSLYIHLVQDELDLKYNSARFESYAPGSDSEEDEPPFDLTDEYNKPF